MLTLKTLDKKIQKLENSIPKTIPYVTYIARKKITSGTEYYEEEKQKLINRGFTMIKKEQIPNLLTSFMLDSNNVETETWEKEYAKGEF